jgi:hypothetical protein
LAVNKLDGFIPFADIEELALDVANGGADRVRNRRQCVRRLFSIIAVIIAGSFAA